jgi:hypothetical protein
MTMRAATERPTFVVRLRAEPGVDDATRTLRQALKVLLRRFGLRAVAVHEDTDRDAARLCPQPRVAAEE